MKITREDSPSFRLVRYGATTRKENQVSGSNDEPRRFDRRSKFEWRPEDIVILTPGDEDNDEDEHEEDVAIEE